MKWPVARGIHSHHIYIASIPAVPHRGCHLAKDGQCRKAGRRFRAGLALAAKFLRQRPSSALERGDLGTVGGYGLLQTQSLATHFLSGDVGNLDSEDGCNFWHDRDGATKAR